MHRSLLLLPFSVALLVSACDKKTPDATTPAPAATDLAATATDTAAGEENTENKKSYLFHWTSEGELNGEAREIHTTVYGVDGEKLEKLGDVANTILIGHETGVTSITHDVEEVAGCGACDESDPVAACKKDPKKQVKFPQDRLVVTLPDGSQKVRTHAPAPSLDEALARHRPSMEYWGQAGRHLFVTYKLEQMPCGADGESRMAEHVVIDAQSGDTVRLLTPEELTRVAQGDVEIAARGQAEAMVEGFDGKLSLKAVQYTLDGSTPNATYIYTGTCGEPCSGMVDVDQDIDFDLPSAIVPPQLGALADEAPAPVAALLDAPNPRRRAQGWSRVEADPATQQKITQWLAAP